MNVNYGLFPPLEGPGRIAKREKSQRLAERALAALEPYRAAIAVATASAPAGARAASGASEA
jgi:hypothetical protein